MNYLVSGGTGEGTGGCAGTGRARGSDCWGAPLEEEEEKEEGRSPLTARPGLGLSSAADPTGVTLAELPGSVAAGPCLPPLPPGGSGRCGTRGGPDGASGLPRPPAHRAGRHRRRAGLRDSRESGPAIPAGPRPVPPLRPRAALAGAAVARFGDPAAWKGLGARRRVPCDGHGHG